MTKSSGPSAPELPPVVRTASRSGSAPRHRRAGRGRTILLAASAVLGLLASAGAGFVLDRPEPLGPTVLAEEGSAGAGTALGAVEAPGAVGPPGSDVPPAPLRRLTVLTHPAGAKLRLVGPDGGAWTALAPFEDRLSEGVYELTATLEGHNRLSRQVRLDRRETLELWLDPKGLLHHKLGTWDGGPAPKQVAFSPDGAEIWISDLGGHGVEVLDAATMRRLDTVKLREHGAVEVIFSRDGGTVFASQMETASVYEIDRATRKVRRQMFTTGSWSKVMALSPDEDRIYVSNWVSDDVSEIDLGTGKEIRRIPTVDTPRGLHVTADGRHLFVAGFENGELQRIGLVDGSSRILVTTGGAMRHLVADPVRGLLYASDMGTDEIHVVDLATLRVRRLAGTDHTPNTIDLSPDGRVLYVSNRGRNDPVSYYVPGPEWGSVLAIDTSTGEYLDAIVGGNQTTGLDVSPDGRTLAFTDFLDNTVTLYEIPSYDVLAAGGGGRYEAHLAELEK